MADYKLKGYVSRSPEEMIKNMSDTNWNLPNTDNDYRSVLGGGGNIQDHPFVAHAVDFKGYFDMFNGGNVGIDAIGSFKRIGNPDQSFNYCTGGNGCWAHHGDDLFTKVTEWPPEDNPGSGDEPATTKGYGACIFSDIIGAHTYQAFFGTPMVINPGSYDFDAGATRNAESIPPWTGWSGSDSDWNPDWDSWSPNLRLSAEDILDKIPGGGGTRNWKWAEAADDGPGRAIRRFDRVGPRGIKFDWFVRGHKSTKGPTLKSLALAYWTPPIGMINHLSDELVDAIPDLIADIAGGSRTQTAINKKQSVEFFTAFLVSQLEDPSKVESKLVGELASMFEDVPWKTEGILVEHIPKKVWHNFVNYVDDSHPNKEYWLGLEQSDYPASFIHVYAAVRANIKSIEKAGSNALAKAGSVAPMGTILSAIIAAIIGVISSLPIVADKLKSQIKRMGIYYCAPLIEWGKPVGEFYESNPNIRFDDTGGSQNMYNYGTSYYCMTDEDWVAVQQKNMKLFIGIVVQLTQLNAADIGIKRNKYWHMMNLGFIYDAGSYGNEILLPPRQRIDQPTEEQPAKYCGMLGNAFWGLRRPYAIGNANDPWVEVWPHGYETGFRSKNEGLGTLGDLHNLKDRFESFLGRFENFETVEDVKEWLESLAPIIEDIAEKVEKILAFIEFVEENKGHILDDIKDAVNEWWNSLTGREQAQIIKQLTDLLSGIIGDQEMIADFTVMKDAGFADYADSNYSNSIFLSDYGVNAYQDSAYQEFFEKSYDTVVLTDSNTIGVLTSGDSALDSDFRSAVNSYFGDGGYGYGFDSLDSNLQPAWWRPDYIHHSQDSSSELWSTKDSYDMIYLALNMAGYDSAGNRIAPDYLYDSFGRIPWIRNLR